MQDFVHQPYCYGTELCGILLLFRPLCCVGSSRFTPGGKQSFEKFPQLLAGPGVPPPSPYSGPQKVGTMD